MPIKRVTFIVIPPNDGQVREFKFSTKLLSLLGVFCLAFVGALCYYSLGYYAHTEEQGIIASLEEENAVLADGLERNKEKIDEMFEAMRALALDDKILRNLHDMDILTAEDRMVGMGGLEELPDDYTQLPPAKRFQLEDINSRINRLQLETKLQEDSFAEIHASFLKNEKDRGTTPSIAPVRKERSTWISSEFGKRVDPFTGRPARHNGVDFAGRRGTKIFATADGTVVYSHDSNKGLGSVVVIQHDTQGQNDDGEVFTIQGKFRTEYGHLEKRLVEVDELVKRGDVIGAMGSSGRSTGPHLHYAVRVQARLRSADKGYVNPRLHLLDDWEEEDPITNLLAANGSE